MTERETIASEAGLRDLQLLKLHPADAPIEAVLADLRGRFGSHPTAFKQDAPDVRNMQRDDYRAAKASMLKGVAADFQRRDDAAVQARIAARYAR